MHRTFLYCKTDILHNAYERNYSIFIVDDEPDTLNTLRLILEENSFKVDAFIDPALALERYIAGSYGLLILDVKMPRMNGFDLYKNIKRNDPKVKTCFLTALSDLDDYAIYKKEVYPKFGERHFVLNTTIVYNRLTSKVQIQLMQVFAYLCCTKQPKLISYQI